MKRFELFIFPILFLQYACSQNYSPKPSAYFHIDLPQPVYHSVDKYSRFEFDISNQASIENVKDSINAEWLNIYYPSYNARIYCSCFSITRESFQAKADESKDLAYFHAVKSDGIEGYAFDNPEKKVYGLVYEIKGNVASPIQFVITDSVRSFFRGALYFDNLPNQDSIAPVLAYINKDIHIILESFRWKQ
jgi:gliding motility-associated lipoprotein GldD